MRTSEETSSLLLCRRGAAPLVQDLLGVLQSDLLMADLLGDGEGLPWVASNKHYPMGVDWWFLTPLVMARARLSRT